MKRITLACLFIFSCFGWQAHAQCTASSIPYTEDFSSGTFPTCWTRSSTTDVTIEATCDSRSNVLNISDTNDVTTGDIDGTTSTTGLKVSYYIGDDLCGDATEDPFDVEYWDGTQWITAETYETDVSGMPYSNTYFHDFFIVPQSDVTTSFKLRFSSNETQAADNWYIDSLVVEKAPTCFVPSSLTATGITTVAADLGWTENNTPAATTWDIYIVTAGSTAPTASTTPTDKGITKNPYTKTGLTQDTSYDFYVRTDCGGGDLSIWAGPYTFSTPCNATTIPYTQSFSSGTFPSCWTRTSTTDVTIEATCDKRSTVLNISDTNDVTTGPIDGSTATAGLKVSYYIGDDLCGDATEDPLDVEYWDGTQWVIAKTYEVVSGVPYDNAYFHDSFIVLKSSATASFKVRFSSNETQAADNWYIDDFMVEDVTCIFPTKLTATGIQVTQADLGWAEGNTPAATKWDIYVAAAGSPAPTASTTPTDIGITKNPYTKTGLTANTDYEFYIRTNCGGGDLSDWAGPYSFTTLCDTYNLPFVETFDESGTPECWTESGDNSWDYSTSAGYAATDVEDHTAGGGTDYAWMDGSDNEDNDKSTLTSPKVDLSTLTNPALEFYAFSNNTDDAAINILEVEFYDGANWNKVITIDQLLGPDWAYFLLDLSSYTITGDAAVRFSVTGKANGGDTQYNDILIDDVSFLEGPSSKCFPPIYLGVSSITATKAKLNWTDNTGATKWDIAVIPDGTAPGTPTKAGVTKLSYTVTGLTGITNYDFYVRASCGGGKSSDWAGPYSFTTLCPVYTFPFVEHFVAGNTPPCWEESGETEWDFSTNAGYAAGSAGDHTTGGGTNYAWMDGSSNTPDEISTLISPKVDISTAATPTLEFYVFSDNTDDNVFNLLDVEFFDGKKWNKVLELKKLLGSSWKEYRINLDSYTITGNVQVRFIVTGGDESGGGETFYNDILIDDVSFEELLPGPDNLVVDSITQKTAVVTWKELGKEKKWELEYGLTGFAQGSGKIVVDDDGIMDEKITGLTPGTEYDVYVRSIDKDGNPSAWVGPKYFVTVCKEFTKFPFKETFEEKSPNRLCARNNYVVGETRWEYVKTNQNGSLTPKQGALMAEFRSTERGESSKLVLGPFDFTALTSPQLTFYYANVAWSGEVDELRVYYKTKIDTTWIQIGQNYDTEKTSWTKVDLALPDPSKNYFIAFEGISHYGRGIDVDEVTIKEAPECAVPSNLSVVPDLVSADISWKAGSNEPGWEIEYGLKGFTPGSGTIVIDNDGTPSLTITGLKPGTEYDLYLTALCADTNRSLQIGPKTFVTKPLGIQDKTFEDFSYYPNPVSNQLSLKATSEIEQVLIYDLLGQEVMKVKPNSLTPILNLNNLQAGTYLMKVNINGSSGMFRIIKK